MVRKTFALVLEEIIGRSKLHLVDVADRAGITAGYLSNLRQGKREQPSQKVFESLIRALQELRVSEEELQCLKEAAGYREEGKKILKTSLFETIGQETENGFTPSNSFPKSSVLHSQNSLKSPSLFSTDSYLEMYEEEEEEGQFADFIKEYSNKGKEIPWTGRVILGNKDVFINKAVEFLEEARNIKIDQGRIYITCEKNLTDVIKNLLKPGSPWKVSHLWSAGQPDKAFIPIAGILKRYLGTSNYFLYKIKQGQLLPEILVVERVGAVIGLPKSGNQYWIIILREEDNNISSITPLIEYLEHLLGAENSRNPLIQTHNSEQSSLDDLEKIVSAEEQNPKEERLIAKSHFSSIYRPVQALSEKLKILGIEDEKIRRHVDIQKRRITTLEKRLTLGKERGIYSKEALCFKFKSLAKNLSLDKKGDPACEAEARITQGEILGMLKATTTSSNFNLGLFDHNFLFFFEQIGNTAAFLKCIRDNSSSDAEEVPAMAWTDHPELLHTLRHEFDILWEKIPSEWRSNSESGRHQIINWIIAETLKSLLEYNVPTQELCAFIRDIIDAAANQSEEELCQELYTHEQSAKHILIINSEFPLSTIPPDIGYWDGKSTVRTRQRILQSILKEGIEKYHLIVSQTGIQNYWETGKYGKKGETFNREWIGRHLRNVHDVFLKKEEYTQKVKVEVIPSPERFLANLEIVDEEFVFLETTDIPREGGLVLQNKELAKEFKIYIEQILTKYQDSVIRQPEEISKWLEREFKEAFVTQQ